MHALQQAKRASARHTNNSSNTNANAGATGLVTRVQPKQNERGRLLIVSGKDLYFLPETLNLGQDSSSNSDISTGTDTSSGIANSGSAAAGDTQQHSNSGVMDEGNSARTSHVKMLRW